MLTTCQFGTTLRIGDGEFDDFTSTWYKAVGIGLAITIAVQVGCVGVARLW